jgi:hypothetical protein
MRVVLFIRLASRRARSTGLLQFALSYGGLPQQAQRNQFIFVVGASKSAISVLSGMW